MQQLFVGEMQPLMLNGIQVTRLCIVQSVTLFACGSLKISMEVFIQVGAIFCKSARLRSVGAFPTTCVHLRMMYTIEKVRDPGSVCCKLLTSISNGCTSVAMILGNSMAVQAGCSREGVAATAGTQCLSATTNAAKRACVMAPSVGMK